MLKMQNISKVYRAGMVETHALREFSLEVDEGEFMRIYCFPSSVMVSDHQR